MGLFVEGRRPAWVDSELYPFTDRWLELPGEGLLHYVDEGPAEGVTPAGTLVFAHGTPTWSFEWRHLIRALSPRWRCVAPDHLGFGLSERPMQAEYTPEAHARRFRGWMEALDLRDVTLVVHDYGGPIALPVALDDASRVARLVVLNSWMWSFEGDRDMERKARLAGGRLGLFLYRAFNASLKLITPSAYGDRRKLTKRIHGQLLAPFAGVDSRERVLWALAHALLGSSAHYASVWERRGALARLPALVVWGVLDPAFPPRFLSRWREALPGARVVELPVGHWPQEEAPDDVLGAIRSFLEE